MFLKTPNIFLKFLKKSLEMELLVKRINFTEDYTEGQLFVNGKYICDTLEDKDRGLDNSMSEDDVLQRKVYGKTAIPIGRYRIIIDYSNKFKKNLIHILNVKGFDGIRIHSLNEASQSLGCIGVGKKTSDGWISESRKTYSIVHSIVEEALKKNENVFITIVN